jgi:hypothetical protein
MNAIAKIVVIVFIPICFYDYTAVNVFAQALFYRQTYTDIMQIV